MNKNYSLVFTKEYLSKKVLTHSACQIALENQCDRKTVKAYCKKFELKTLKHANTNLIPTLNTQYNSLFVKELLSTEKNSNFRCKCTCECGKDIEVLCSKIVTGHTKSCGCLKFKIGDKHKNWKGYGEIPRRAYYNIKYNTRRGKNKQNILEFNLTPEYIWKLFLIQNRKCALSGIGLIFAKSNKELLLGLETASLDRIDSSKGYVEGNVQWVHKIVNLMKLDLSQDEFIKWCNNISEYRKTLCVL